jgi:hypothetical protein
MKTVVALISLLASLVLVGCSPGQDGGGSSSSGGFTVTGYAAPLSDSEYNSLSPEQQYAVLNKLLGTIYKGMPVDEFFNVSAGLTNPQVQFTDGLRNIRTALRTDMDASARAAIDASIVGLDSEGNENDQLAIYSFDEDRPRALPLARIHEYPLSRDGFVTWMAYFMANTILFSPALEYESTDIVNVQNVVRRLSIGIGNDLTVRQLIAQQLPTIDRWRVSRSPQNHALEAYELYLGLFDTEEDSREGGIACGDLYLTDEDEGYQLARTDFPNTTPQYILDDVFEITTCDDFHAVIAGHPLVLPRVTEVIINYLMDGRTQTDRLNMIESIVGSGAETFEQIFTAIIFSREYLLNTERPKSFEESLMALLSTLKWDVRRNFAEVDDRIFDRLTSSPNDTIYLGHMGWDSMALKIGRMPFVPMDALSFSNYHKAVREELLRQHESYRGSMVTVNMEDANGDINGVDMIAEGLVYGDDGDGNLETLQYIADLSPQEYVDLLFLTALARRATAVEMTDLIDYLDNVVNHLEMDNGRLDVINNRHDEIAQEVLDYISRLPEFYYVKTVN